MKARKLPSGSWRCQVFSHYEYRDGVKKRVYKSFTCKDPSPKGRKECERMATEWSLRRSGGISGLDVHQAIEQYIMSKDRLLSPSTLRSYRIMAKNSYASIDAVPLDDLSQSLLQRWINEQDATAKSVRNRYALLRSALDMFEVPSFRVTLPDKGTGKVHSPTDEDISALIKHVRHQRYGDGQTLLIAIMLAAFCSMRRGEICALEDKDIYDGKIHVTKAIVQRPDDAFEVKKPKTASSVREIVVPQFILDEIGDRKGRIVPLEPPQLTSRFDRAIKATFHGEKKFSFHSLRHYYVSASHALKIPEAYTMKMGGWATPYVMKSVYRDTLDDVEKKESARLNWHFSTVFFDAMHHEMQHEGSETLENAE